MLLKALDAFEHASQADRNAPEPLFNMTLIYRRLRLLKLAEESLRQYSVLDKGSEWLNELSNPERIDEASVLDQLEHAVAGNDLAVLLELVGADAERAGKDAWIGKIVEGVAEVDDEGRWGVVGLGDVVVNGH